MKLYESQTYSVKQITEMTGISKATLYRYLKSNTK
ncbi:helix-turn-helix transcriptional regulator [Jeotgalibaca porci]